MSSTRSHARRGRHGVAETDGPGCAARNGSWGHLHVVGQSEAQNPHPRRSRSRATVSARSHQVDLGQQDRPGKVFDRTLPLEQAAEGSKAMDERRATKVILTL